MSNIKLVKVSAEYADKIVQYRAEFPDERMRVTYDPERIPGLDYLEKYDDVHDWIAFCEEMSGKITWYMSVRESDDRVIGVLVLRHKLAYDDDDIEFASNLGYSIRPSERGKGYAKEQLRLGLQKAKELGLEKVRIVCRDINIGSNKTILANGGVYVDTICGELSGMKVNRYDIRLSALGNIVKVTVDRPSGTCHPKHKDIYYPINYGYVEGIMAPDGEEQDAYILGVNEAVQEFVGKVIAIIHRYDDVEEKWVVAPEDMSFTRDEIMEQVRFQEQYFQSEIRM